MPAASQPRQRVIDDSELHKIARDAMQAHFRRLYGFRAEDVIEMHFHRHGIGRGVWYRLKDGRVIDALGRPAERDRSWYVTAAQ